VNNYFVIKHDAGEVARFVDGPALSNLESALLDLVRRGFAVTYDNATSAPLVLPAPSIEAPAERAPQRARQAQRRKPGPALAAIIAARRHPTSAKTWNKGDIVFIAWREISTGARVRFTEKREAMGVVEEFRVGRGISRTIGVRFDSDAELTWLAPRELSHDCQYCKENSNGK
jgi:hypothetical protein